MLNLKGLIMLTILIVLSIMMVPIMWSSIYDTTSGVLACQQYNTTKTDIDVDTGVTCAKASCCTVRVNGVTSTLMQLVPFIFVGLFVLGGIVVGKAKGYF
jgi:hypothetical protein